MRRPPSAVPHHGGELGLPPFVEELLVDVTTDGFALYCCGPKLAPNALVAAYEWEQHIDLLTIRDFNRVTTARVPKLETVDIFAPEIVVWAYEGLPQQALRALLDLVHPAHPDAPIAEYPAPASLHVPRTQQRPMTIRPPSPNQTRVRADRLATAMRGDRAVSAVAAVRVQGPRLVQMQEWREHTVARILSLQPRRVLEIGVGSGLLLSQLAPGCEAYWATDFSAPAIEVLSAHVEQGSELSRRVVLRTQPAHDTDGLPVGWFDTVILNSVIQYFPTTDYLVDVLDRALRLLAPGGAIFIGDVRNLRLLRTLATAVQLHRAAVSTEAATVRRAVEQAVLMEKELLADPEFFTALQSHIADIGGVDIQIKRGRYHNELTCYRYDVVLHKHPITPMPLSQVPRLCWGHQVQCR